VARPSCGILLEVLVDERNRRVQQRGKERAGYRLNGYDRDCNMVGIAGAVIRDRTHGMVEIEVVVSLGQIRRRSSARNFRLVRMMGVG